MASLTQFLRRSAQINGKHTATVNGDRKFTWEDILSRTQRTAALLADLGLKPGSRVAILSNNSDIYLEYLFGVSWAGGVIVPINTRLSPPEINAWLTDSGAEVLVVGDEQIQAIAALDGSTANVKHFIYIGDGATPEGYLNHEASIANCEAIDDANRSGDDLAALFYTGGTTGRSKGVMITHQGIFTNILQWAVGVQATPEDRFLLIPPMFHAAGGINAIAVAALGATGIILPSFNVLNLLSIVETEKVSNIPLIATMLDMVVNHPQVGEFDLSSVTRITYGASPIPEGVLEKSLSVFPNAKLYQVFGQTEGGPTVTILPPKYHVTSGPNAGKLKSTGYPVLGVDLCIMDEEGNTLDPNQKGEICVRGPAISPGYWNLPDETAEANRFGWLHTGDAGYLDEAGLLYVVDRIKDMIISGGENVYPAEVENVLLQHDAIAECVVIGIPSEKWGEEVHAIIRLNENRVLTENEVLDYCRQFLAGFKCARSVTFRTEPFPISAANKVLKRELRKPFWGQRGKTI